MFVGVQLTALAILVMSLCIDSPQQTSRHLIRFGCPMDIANSIKAYIFLVLPDSAGQSASVSGGANCPEAALQVYATASGRLPLQSAALKRICPIPLPWCPAPREIL
jgi:hypothetical protein